VESGSDFRQLEGAQGVGTRGGSQDHAAILLSRRDEIGLWSYRPTRNLGRLAFPSHWRLAIATSGVVAAKAGNALEAYNRAARLAEAAAAQWRQASGSDAAHLGAALAEGSPEQIRRALARVAKAEFSAADLIERFDHFFVENGEVVPACAAAIEVADAAALGRAAARSQELAERLLHNQVPETGELVSLALKGGATAASAFGAGYGGSVWAIVPAEEARTFLHRWASAYRQRRPRHSLARFLLTKPGPPGRVIARPPDPAPGG
jgi:galactokinase